MPSPEATGECFFPDCGGGVRGGCLGCQAGRDGAMPETTARRTYVSFHPRPGFELCTDPGCTYMRDREHYHEVRHGQLSAEERASMFMDWCALHDFGLSGWPAGAHAQLVAHIRQGERPFPLRD